MWLGSIGAQKLGQPVPESNFWSSLKSVRPQAAQTNTPFWWMLFNGLVKARSVPSLRSTLYCSGVRIFFHSSSVLTIFSITSFDPFLSLVGTGALAAAKARAPVRARAIRMNASFMEPSSFVWRPGSPASSLENRSDADPVPAEEGQEFLFVHGLDPQLARVLGLGAGVLADHYGVRGLADRAGGAGAQGFDVRLGVAAGEAGEAAGEEPLLPRKRVYGSVPPPGCGRARLHQAHAAGELVEHLGVVRLGEEGGDLLGHARARPRDLLEGGLVRRAQAGEGAEVPGEVARHGDAHLGDPQAIEEAGELGGGAGLLQGVHQLVGRFLGEPLQLHELLGADLEEVGELLHQPLSHEELGGLVPQPLDVQGVARGEVDDAAGELRRALEAVGADGERAALNQLGATGGADVRHLPLGGALVAGLLDALDHLGDDVPARWTRTRSPSRTSLRATSSRLCRVARATVTPPISTGSMIATGVTTPVRPTEGRIERMRVTSLRGGNLKA